MGQKADQALTDFCAQHTCAELEEIFNKVGIPNQRAYEPGDIENDPQYAERENLVEWEDQIFGEMKGIGITNRFKNNPSQIVASAPCFGEHNREVLQEFGYTDKEIDDLYKKGEIVTWTPADTARIRHLPDWGFFWDTERQCERIGMEWPLKDK
jgi:crotonobetainyl-CoA:carnitine CoA-transferase CaiB-like acyl-CoA transferase